MLRFVSRSRSLPQLSAATLGALKKPEEETRTTLCLPDSFKVSQRRDEENGDGMALQSKPVAFANPLPCRNQSRPGLFLAKLLPAVCSPPIPSHAKRRRTSPSCIIEPLNRLRIEADWQTPVASGSFGEVFFGSLSDTGEPIVLKRSFSDSTARTLFRVERSINRKLDPGPEISPSHWPKFLGEHFRNSQTFLVWRRTGDGDTLADFLSSRPLSTLCAALRVRHTAAPLNLPLFCAVVGTLLTALADLHEHGIVHRDVKPANILVAPGEDVPLKLIDFGSSCDVRNIFSSRGINTLDPLYAAPEQRLSPLAPQKFDVFSVGMIGLSVLLPSFAGKARLREFKSRLESADFDLRRYRDEFTRGVVGRGGDVELAALFNVYDDRAVAVFELLAGMLKKSPGARKSVKAALIDLGL